MIELLFERERIRARLRSGPLGPYLDVLADLLRQEGYARCTMRRHIRSAEAFCLWLQESGVRLGDVTPAVMGRYIRELGRRPRAGQRCGRLPESAFGLKQFSDVL